jgi:hypothetical protein
MVALCGSSGCYDRARFEIGDAPYQYDTSQSGLVSYWPMDETSGTTVEDVKDNNNGTASGTTIVDGKYRKARSFDGSSDYINTGNFISLFAAPGNTWTVGAWFKWVESPVTRGTGNVSHTILGKSGGIATAATFTLYNGINTAYGTTENYTMIGLRGVNTAVSPSAVNDNNWHYAAITWDGSTAKMYFDGEYQGDANVGTAVEQSQNLIIGSTSNGSSSHCFQGTIDEVLLFNTALDSTQIENLYNSSRPSTNPSDTLYAIQISTDNFVSDIRYIDGSTNEPKNSVTLNDFRTKSQWESETFNILGLQEGTQYYLRIIALHGDFTQTEEGPPETATTGQASCSFDIDIADESGTTAETDPPFNITFTGDNALLAGAGTVVADNLVWMDAETNGSGGFAIVQRGKNGGLYSPTLAAQINSVNGDLDTLSEGFGLQNYYIDYATDTGLGTITAESNYNGSVSNVGIVDTDWNKVYDSSGPTVTGRMALYVMARAGSDKQGATDYQESITFILVPRY